MTEKKKSRMYEVNGKRVRTWNVFKGCRFGCNYCIQRDQAKRQKHRCELCYQYKPHLHPERLNEKFKAGETVFVAAAGDISFASDEEFELILNTIEKYPKTTFMLQSKDPRCFLHHEYLTDNVIIGTTIETTEDTKTISKAPRPIDRVIKMLEANNPRRDLPERYIAIEPIMEFDLVKMVAWIQDIKPKFVYAGYLNPVGKAKKLQIPEPSLEKTIRLCKELDMFTEVRLKTMRKAHYE